MFNIVLTDYTGSAADISFLENDNWLNDAVVNYQLYQCRGRWKIKLWFTWVQHRRRVIYKYFKEEYDKQTKAEVYATYFLRTIQKDARGTLYINNNDYNICNN